MNQHFEDGPIHPVDIHFNPSAAYRLIECIDTIDKLPEAFKKKAIEGAVICYHRYDFGIIFSQKIVVSKYVFWAHWFHIDQLVDLHPVTDGLLITLHYMLRGDIVCRMNGDLVNLIAGKYQIYGLAPRIEYSATLKRGDYFCFHAALPHAIIPELADSYQDLEQLMDLLKQNSQGLHYPKLLSIPPAIERHIYKMLSQRKINKTKQTGIRDFLWEEQLLRLFNQYFHDKETLQKRELWVHHTTLDLDNLTQYVVDHLADDSDGLAKPLRLEQMLVKTKLSEFRFRRSLQRQYHCTWEEFVHRTRMERAKELLDTDPAQSFSGIAYSLGYTTLSHFSRAFKLYFKKSPSAYRRQHPPEY